jgi:Fe-S-cluster containining protein
VWFSAARGGGIDAALRGMYADLDAAVAARGPTCWVSGRCCKFEAYGHRLYVTALEIAWFLGQVQPPPDVESHWTACPYQINGLCTAHAARPLGCRVFFCQRGTQEWQHALYEDFQRRLRDLHDANDLPYRYLEWRAGLREACTARGAM